MKDRFKFRAWNKEKKTMHYKAEQTYDCLDGIPLIYKSSFGDVLDDENYIVEQCTGLKDKNGKFVFEGDVVRLDGLDEVFIVVYEENFCGVGLKHSDGLATSVTPSILKNSEVIGNIHENAELLK